MSNWNRCRPCVWAAIWLAAIRSAATVFFPSVDHEPVNDTSTPIFVGCDLLCLASTLAAKLTRARSSPQTITCNTARIFISARSSEHRRNCQDSSIVGIKVGQALQIFTTEDMEVAENSRSSK